MNTFEHFRNDMLMGLTGLPAGTIGRVLSLIDRLYEHYDVVEKSTEIAPINTRLLDLMQVFLVVRSSEGVADSTIKQYKYTLRDFVLHIGKPLENIVAMDIRLYLHNYQIHHGISNRSLDSMRTTIHTFFEWLLTNEYITKNPAKAIPIIKHEKTPRQALTKEELTILRNNITDLRDRVMLEVMYGTGCRVSELCGMKLSDIDMRTGAVHILGKGRKHRTSYLTPEARVALTNYLNVRNDTCPYVVVSSRNPVQAICRSTVESRVKQFTRIITETTGKHVTPHIFRHTFATAMVNAGANIVSVSNLLGHSSPTVTMVYAHQSNTSVKADHERFMG